MGRPLIGSRKEALEILTNESDGLGDLDGWTLLGSGCYRAAFLAPSGVVYKIGQRWANVAEVRVARRLRARTFDGIYIPLASAFSFGLRGRTEVVCAMEYIEGTHPRGCWESVWKGVTELYCHCGAYPENAYGDPHLNVPPCDEALVIRTVKRATRLSDVHNENVIRMKDGRIAVIDLQM